MPAKKKFTFTVTCEEDALKALLGDALEKMLGVAGPTPTLAEGAPAQPGGLYIESETGKEMITPAAAALPTNQTSGEASGANEQAETVTADEPLLPVSAPNPTTASTTSAVASEAPTAPIATSSAPSSLTHDGLKLKIREWVFAGENTEEQVARTNKVNGLLMKFGVEKLTNVPPESLGAFGTELAVLGVGV